MNNVALVGRVSNDPIIRTTQSGGKVASFGIAVSRQKKEETDFFNVVAWDKTADFIDKYIVKGRLISVTGRLQQKTWESEGQKRHSVEVIADSVNPLDSKKEQAASEDPFALEGEVI